MTLGLPLLARLLDVEPASVFPWQARLLDAFCRQPPAIPSALDIPTGLGKTAVIAVWLAARASGARLPRRLVYVVDRRAVVDQASEVALRLRKVLDADPQLRAKVGVRDGALAVSTLRGQFIDNREWLADPAAPAIVVGTVDMVGSRLLFEGYGVSRKMRPCHAGLLGADTLLVLDEAHLVPPFEHLLRSVETDPAVHPRDEAARGLVPAFRMLALSATGRTDTGAVFGLAEDDHAHSVVRKRLMASKRLSLVPVADEEDLPVELARAAWSLAAEGHASHRVLVFANRRTDAEQTRVEVERLAKAAGGGLPAGAIELLVGARRNVERDPVARRLSALGFIAGSAAPRAGPAFLIATSAGEVGVDLDADHMVCDLVAFERMVQRLGRVNRRGERDATVRVLVAPYDPEAERSDPSRSVWEARHEVLRQLPAIGHDGERDASPGALAALRQRAATQPELANIVSAATTDEPLRPGLTRPVVDAWSMTSLLQHTGRPDVRPWLRGWTDDEAPETDVVWRSFLPVDGQDVALPSDDVAAFFEAAALHTSERLSTETWRVLAWALTRAEALAEREPATAGSGRAAAAGRVVAFLRGSDDEVWTPLTLSDLQPLPRDQRLERRLSGATLVVDARLAGLNYGLLDPASSEVPITADGPEGFPDPGVGFRVRTFSPEGRPDDEAGWREQERFAVERSEEGEVRRWLVVERRRLTPQSEEGRSTGTRPQLLDEHQSWAESEARALAAHLHLDAEATEALALAALLHDEGKRAENWQRAFSAPRDGVYAKTSGPLHRSILLGYRHELGSLLRTAADPRWNRLPERWRDLVRHLIASHHGGARPLLSTAGCSLAPPSVLREVATDVALRFSRLQAEWGPWGLAWWEALLRGADQRASRRNDEAAASTGGSRG